MDVETILNEVQHVNTMLRDQDLREAAEALQDLEDELVDEVFGVTRDG